MTLSTVFDPYRAAQAIADLDLIKAANPGCYMLGGVPYVATMTPAGIVLAKAGRRAAPGQMSLFSAPSGAPKAPNKNVGRTKTKDGVTYRLNENSRWERVDDAKEQQGKPSLSIVKDDLPPLEDLFARADEVGSKYQDPSDPIDLGARRAADAIVDEAMGGLTNEARGVADLGARRRAKVGGEGAIASDPYHAALQAINESEAADPLKNVPEGVQSKISAAINRTRMWNGKVARARETDQKFQGGGRYTWEVTNGEQLQEPDTIQLFRDMAAKNGVDADAALAAMGYEPPTQLNHQEMNTDPLTKTVSLGGARYALAGATLRRL